MNTYIKFLIKLTFLLFLLFIIEKATAQIEVSLLYQNSFEQKLPSTTIPKQIKSASELNEVITNLLQNLHNEGYWNAKMFPFDVSNNIDSLNSKSKDKNESKNKSNSKNKLKLVVDLGKRAFWKKLSTNSIPTLIQKNVISDFERKDFLKKLLKNR